jgi:hypothetical protein
LCSRQKNLGKRVPKFKTRDKKGNLEGKKRCGGWDENLSQDKPLIEGWTTINYVKSRVVFSTSNSILATWEKLTLTTHYIEKHPFVAAKGPYYLPVNKALINCKI